jgi:hypothetical protein
VEAKLAEQEPSCALGLPPSDWSDRRTVEINGAFKPVGNVEEGLVVRVASNELEGDRYPLPVEGEGECDRGVTRQVERTAVRVPAKDAI